MIYQAVSKGAATGPKGVCERADRERMERTKPGGTVVIRAGLAHEAVAERLARGTSGDASPRGSKMRWPGGA